MRPLDILEILPPRTNPLVAIAEVDNPVIEVTMVERRIMRTPRPVSNEKIKDIAFYFSSLDFSLPQTILPLI